MTRRRRARRRPTVQYYANLTDRSSIGYVARELASYLGSSMGTDCTVQCTTGRRALDVPAAIQRHVSSADIGFFWGFPRDSRKHLWKHKQFIGAYVCEGNRIPHEWVELCNQHSAIIVPSQHCFRAFTDSGVTVPVHVVRHGLSPHFRNDGLDKFPGFIFFTAFNANPWMARKGVNELLGAFVRLKERYDQVWLIIKTNASPAVSHWGDLPGVKLVLNRYETPDLVKLYQQCHAYVQPTRGEGFGLTYIEALACGLPIVVPNHTGVTEFVDPERDCIIETDGSLVSMETYLNPIGQLYDVTEDAVYDAMLDVFLHQEEYRRKAATFDAAAWSWHKVLHSLHDVIESVREMPPRKQPDIVVQEYIPPVPQGNAAVVTPLAPIVPVRSGASLFAGARVTPHKERQHRGVRLYLGDRQSRAYEQDCTGLGNVVRQLAERMVSTSKKEGTLIAPFNPEHCDYTKFPSPVVAYVAFESDRWPSWWVEKLNHCAMVVVPQQWLKDALEASGCVVPVAVVPQAFNVRKRPQRTPSKAYTFGFLGVPVKRKNLDLLIQALPAGARLRLHAAWMPPGSVKRGGSMVTTTIGRIADDELDRTFWSEIDCLVVPSAGEGYSMVPREAIAMGIPTIVSDIPAHEDIKCTKISTSSGEPAFYEFCGQTVGHWHKVDVEDLRSKLAAAMTGEFDVAPEDQRCPDHSWDSTVVQLKDALKDLVVTFSPAEAEGGGVERFSRRLAAEWDGAHHVSDIEILSRLGSLVKCLVVQFEYGLFQGPVLSSLEALKKEHGFKVVSIIHSANGMQHNQQTNLRLGALSDRLILLNPAQSKFFKTGQKSEHPWPAPGEYRKSSARYLGNHGNIHPQKGYRHLFAVAAEMGRPVRIIGRLDASNPASMATHKRQIEPFATGVDDLRLEYCEDGALDAAMGECAALLYPYEPVANIQASGAVRDAIRAGRPILCSGHEDYFDLPPCFPRLPLDSPGAMAAQVETAIKNGKAIFEKQAEHARTHGWSWFVDVLKDAAGTRSVQERTRPLILIIGQTLGLGGAEKVTVDIATALDQSGIYRVQVAMVRTSRGIYRNLLGDSIDVFDVPSPSSLVDHVAQHKPDGILINNAGMVKAVVGKLAAHRPSFMAFLLHGYVQWSLNVLPSVLPPGVEVLTISDDVKEGLIRARRDLNAGNVTVIKNAIDTDRFRPATEPSEIATLPWSSGGPVFGYAGRLSAEKALPVMVEIFKMAKAYLPNAKLLIVGGADVDGVKADVDVWKANEFTVMGAIQKHGVKDDVVITGVVKDPERYYRAMDVLLLTSHFEGLPLVVMEAMASGVPVVSTAVGGVPDLLASGGGVTVENNRGELSAHGKSQFVKQMVAVASAKGNAMGAKGRAEIILNYSHSKYAAEILGYFGKRVVAGSGLKVAGLYDSDGWAFHMAVEQVKRGMDPGTVSLVRYEDLAPGSIRDFDVVYSPSYIFNDRLREAIGPETRVVGTIADHYTWRDGPGAIELRKAIALCDVLICTNRRLFWEVRSAYPDAPLALCMSGVDAELFKPVPRKRTGKPLIVGWAGSTQYHHAVKGVELITRACSMVPDVQLVLADAGSRKRSQEEMVEFYQSLDIYVCMSSSEGTCNPILEAAACGVGVVSTDVGVASALLDSVQQPAGVLIARNVGALSAALRALVKDRDLVEEMGINARKAIDDGGWDWPSRVKSYVTLIEEVSHGD